MMPKADEEDSNDSNSNNEEYGVVLKKKKNIGDAFSLKRVKSPLKMKIHIK